MTLPEKNSNRQPVANSDRKKVFVVEWITGGGLEYSGEVIDVESSLYRQGLSMRTSVADDFVAAGHDVYVLVDSRDEHPCREGIEFLTAGKDFRQTVCSTVTESDFVLVVAPECEGILLKCADWLAGHSSKWLFPNRQFIELCSNKRATIEFLDGQGIATPASIAESKRWVVKPNDGCGSEGIRVIESGVELNRYRQSRDWLVEPFVDGTPASVSVIGGRTPIFLRPLRQCFATEPIGEFVEGVDDLNPAQIEMALSLAQQVCRSLPKTAGYFGIDMVIGESHATAIEVNPRLTDSYSTLRKIHDFNLAERMLTCRSNQSRGQSRISALPDGRCGR